MYNSKASKLTNSLDVFRQIWACTDDSKGGNNLLEYLNHIEGESGWAYTRILLRLVEVEAQGAIQTGKSTDQE